MLHPNADKLVANENKILVKTPATIWLFKNKDPDTKFPSNSSNYTLGNVVRYQSVMKKTLKSFCSVINVLDISGPFSIAILNEILTT
jgi:hypothetical protein